MCSSGGCLGDVVWRIRTRGGVYADMPWGVVYADRGCSVCGQGRGCNECGLGHNERIK